jgi:hypothetical protein
MREKDPQSCVTQLLSYPKASGDMYYSVVNERIVCVSDDPEQGYRIWGEIPGGGMDTAVDLCQVFLEYAMTCAAEPEQSQGFCNMESFGSRLGEALAQHIKRNTAMGTAKNLGACALECILEAMNAHFTVEQVGTELRFVLECCPLNLTAKRTGLPDVELAHHGINSLCQSLIHALEPHSSVYLPVNEQADHIFMVVAEAIT